MSAKQGSAKHSGAKHSGAKHSSAGMREKADAEPCDAIGLITPTSRPVAGLRPNLSTGGGYVKGVCALSFYASGVWHKYG